METTADGSLAQGRAALDRNAWEAAREAFEASLEQVETAEALEGLGWALYWLDRTAESLAARERAFRLYRESGERRKAARVAWGLAVDNIDLRGEAPAWGWLERARQMLEGLEPGREDGWLALWEGHFALVFRHDRGAARDKADAALEAAARFGAHDLEVLARALDGLLLVAEGDVAEGMRRLDGAAASALAGELTELDAVSTTCCLLVHACERVRDYGRAAVWGERVERFSRERGIAPALAVCRTQAAAMLLGRGEWRAAEEELERALARLASSRPLLLAEGIEQLAELRRRQGRFDEAEALFVRAEGRSLPLLGRAWIAFDRGDVPTAVDLAERFLRRTPPDNWTGRGTALELLVRARLAPKEGSRADTAAHELRELASRVALPLLKASATWAEGLRLLALGDDLEQARMLLEDAHDQLQVAHAPFEAARARLDLVQCLRALGREEAARREAREALEGFVRLGARHEADRARRLAEETPSPFTGAAAGAKPPPLTDRELEVLRLVGEGLGDKDIAARLGLSAHTVHRHVSNIRTKLGLPSRAAAVAWAAQNRLL